MSGASVALVTMHCFLLFAGTCIDMPVMQGKDESIRNLRTSFVCMSREWWVMIFMMVTNSPSYVLIKCYMIYSPHKLQWLSVCLHSGIPLMRTHLGPTQSVQIREVSLFQGCLIYVR